MATASLKQEVEPSTLPLPPPPPPPLQVHLEGQAKQSPPLPQPLEQETELVDFSKRAQWLRAAMMGAIEGVVATASLMMGVGAINKDVMTMAISGAAGMIVGACTMAIGELVSVYSQYDIEVARIQREDTNRAVGAEERDASKEKLPSPWQAAGASALASAVGALVPLLAASFIEDYKLRLWVVIVAVSIALLGFGGLSAKLGKASAVKSASRALLGGWLAMGITYGVTKMINGL
ncbi:vacuolar iron transporter homolog 2-like [Syzygium oleosum]|uniref:vacuolar iron transporter homolog 2-like n=1 Tax=Syzygium oleosum TaxID=219896 RepID=UPI0011D18E67|nr:vacuolar iron transporter homolog 2-like [Syzygium oleosum]XP_056164002.1 vacuolar iron transporter homolog 2-like [Syzygium oleosum]